MRLRVISARNEIPNLNPNEKTVHLAFRASNIDFLNLMQRCPRLRMIQVPPSAVCLVCCKFTKALYP